MSFWLIICFSIMFTLELSSKLIFTLLILLFRQRHLVVYFLMENQEQHSQRTDECFPKIFPNKLPHQTLFRHYKIQSVPHLLEMILRHNMILLWHILPYNLIFALLIRYVVVQELSTLTICYFRRLLLLPKLTHQSSASP